MFGIDVESLVSESNIPYKSIYLNQGGLETNYRIYIYNNYIHHNAKEHFVNTDGTYITLQNNTFEGYNIGGISSYPNQWYIQYLNNTFTDCELAGAGNNVVHGGVFNRANINLANVQGALIENCQIKDGLFYGSSIYGYLGMPASVNTATGIFAYSTPHGMGNGAQVSFEQWFGKVPTGISVDKLYYTVNITPTGFQVSETKDGKPVVITDAGTPGFNISRYNYGRCYIFNITVEKDWKDNNAYDGKTGFLPLIAGGVMNNITVKNCGMSIKPPANYMGRPNIAEGLTIIEGTGNFESSLISNLKAVRIKTGALGGDITLGSNTLYSRVNLDQAVFRGVQVNLVACFLSGGQFLNAKISKTDAPFPSMVTNSYLENTALNLHWVTYEKSMIIAKCLFNNISIDASPFVKMFDNLDLNTGLSDNRASAPPTAGKFALGYILYNAAPALGGYAGWICTTAGYAENQTWTASKAYNQGSRIYFSGHVYEAASNGTSGKTAPAFPVVTGGSVADNTVTWKEIGISAVFKPFGAIGS